MQRSETSVILFIHIRTFVNKHFDDFFVTPNNRGKHSSLAALILRIDICTSSQMLHDGLDIPFFYSVLNRDIWRLKFDWRLIWLRDFRGGGNWWYFYRW